MKGTRVGAVVLLAGVIVFAQLAAAQTGASTLGAGPPVKLRWAAGDTPTQRQHVAMVEWANKIRERSNGRVSLEVFSVADLGVTGGETARLLENGTVDISKLGAQQLSGEFPVIELPDLAFQSPDLATARQIGERWLPIINERLKTKNIKLLTSWPFGAQVFFCKGSVKSIADLKGKKVRGAGATVQKWLRSVGAVPVDIDFAEVYTALERGVAECAITGLISGYTQKWGEVTTSLYLLPAQWGVNFTGANLATWNKLPADVQTFLNANFEEMGNALWQLQGQLDETAVMCNTGLGACPYGQPGKLKRADVSPEELKIARRGYEMVSLADWLARCNDCAPKYNDLIAPLTGIQLKK